MRNNISNAVLIPVIRLSFVEEDGSGPIGHQSPILHGTHCKFVDRQEIRLGQWVLDLEDLRKVVDRPMSTLQRKPSLILEAPRGVDANRDALALILALGHRLNIFEIANCPCQKLQERTLG